MGGGGAGLGVWGADVLLAVEGRVVDMCIFFLVDFAGGIGAAPLVSALLPCYLWTFLPF
jgi:hypothetical protein